MITIRQANAADEAIVRDIIRDSFLASYVLFLPESFTRKSLENDRFAEIAREDGCNCVLAEVDGAPAGVMLRKEDYIEQLWTHPCFMGRGVGSALLRHAAQQAAQAGHNRLTLNCFEKNARALNFYLSRGFTVDTIYTATEYAPGERVCFLIMQL